MPQENNTMLTANLSISPCTAIQQTEVLPGCKRASFKMDFTSEGM